MENKTVVRNKNWLNELNKKFKKYETFNALGIGAPCIVGNMFNSEMLSGKTMWSDTPFYNPISGKPDNEETKINKLIEVVLDIAQHVDNLEKIVLTDEITEGLNETYKLDREIKECEEELNKIAKQQKLARLKKQLAFTVKQ